MNPPHDQGLPRRVLLAAAGAAALTGEALAQPAAPPLVAVLNAADREPMWSLLRRSMADAGYVEGRTVRYEYREARPAGDALARFAAELVALKPAVIVAIFTPAVAAAMKATTTIPIVFNAGAPDAGLVTNLARPEGNATGVHQSGSDLAGKCVQLVAEARPGAKSVGAVINLADPLFVAYQKNIREVAASQRLELVEVGVRTTEELVSAFETMQQRRVDGVVLHPSLGMTQLAALALKHRLVSISIRKEFAEVGGLMAYSGSQAEGYRVVAGQVDKVLKGARPADLPVQQTTRFELALNQKTARALGIAFPPAFLARVDDVIE